jgi:hypothetical protein
MDLSRMFNRLGGLRPGARLCYVAPNNVSVRESPEDDRVTRTILSDF